MKKYRLAEFQLSQSYLFYWDKIEKANYFLENVLDTLDEEIDGRLVQALLASPVGDGGQWDMGKPSTMPSPKTFANLIVNLRSCEPCTEVWPSASDTIS